MKLRRIVLAVAIAITTASPMTTLAVAVEPDEEYSRMNDVLYYRKCVPGSSSSTPGPSTTTPLVGSDNAEKVWNYFKDQGYSDEQVAGIMGNLAWESGDPSFNSATDSEELSGGGGYGLAQWTGSRRAEIEKAGGSRLTDLQFQLDYLNEEINTRTERDGGSKTEAEGLKEQGSVADATEYFMYNFERPGHLALQERIDLANQYLAKYGGGGSGGATATSSNSSSDGCEPVKGTPGSSEPEEIDGFNYAFPVVLGKSEVSNGYGWPCPRACHHDGTTAFDLSRSSQDDTSEGVAVVAVTDGKIERFNNSYAGVSGCQSFQLVGKDGYQYWNGHVQNASVQDGAEVTAGQQIAEIGRRACTGNGSYPHLHIDRGGKGTPGGSIGNRDGGFNDLINKLWEGLGG